VIRGIPDAEQSRGISAVVDGVRIVNLYVVNGQDTASDRYTYKLDWLRRTTERVSAWAGGPLVVCGDYNIAPDDLDCYDPEGWKGKIHCSEPEREAFRGLLALGLTDAYRAHHAGEAGRYTWWDYRGDMYGQHKGLRIDHHLVSAPVAGRVTEVSIDSEERGLQGASDHAPVTLHLR
jgi:exodeoxyribonuclease-3